MEYHRVPVPLIHEILDELKKRNKSTETSSLIHQLVRGLDSHVSGLDIAQAATKEEIVEIVKILRTSQHTTWTQDKSDLALNLNTNVGKIKSAVMQFFLDKAPVVMSEERTQAVKKQQDQAAAQVEEIRRRYLEENKRKQEGKGLRKAGLVQAAAASSSSSGPVAEGPFKILTTTRVGVPPPVSLPTQIPAVSSSSSSTAAAVYPVARTAKEVVLSRSTSSSSSAAAAVVVAAAASATTTTTAIPPPMTIPQLVNGQPPPAKFVVVMVGIPGAGKSTMAHRLVSRLGEDRAAVFSQDVLRTNTAVRRNALQALNLNKQVVIIDRTNWTTIQRQTWTELAQETGAIAVSVEVRRDLQDCINRCVIRGTAHPSHQPGSRVPKFPLERPEIAEIVSKFSNELQDVAPFAEGFHGSFVSVTDQDMNSVINEVVGFIVSGGVNRVVASVALLPSGAAANGSSSAAAAAAAAPPPAKKTKPSNTRNPPKKVIRKTPAAAAAASPATANLPQPPPVVVRDPDPNRDPITNVARLMGLDEDTVRGYYVKHEFNWNAALEALHMYKNDLVEAKQMDQVRLLSESTAVDDKLRARADKLKELMTGDLMDKFPKSELMRMLGPNIVTMGRDQDRRMVCVELLEVEDKAIKWWAESARAFARSRHHLANMLTTDELRAEIRVWSEALYAMPDKAGAPPTAFAKCVADEKQAGMGTTDVIELE